VKRKRRGLPFPFSLVSCLSMTQYSTLTSRCPLQELVKHTEALVTGSSERRNLIDKVSLRHFRRRLHLHLWAPLLSYPPSLNPFLI
jgi:hypothetical protein